MLQNIRKRNEGFTIIEVLIVLAIAGLIMLIVFLAVPALQRNSRNTSRRNDVGRVGGAVQDVLNNNANSVAAVTSTSLRSAVGNQLAFYIDTGISVATAAPAPAGTNSTTIDTIIVYMGAVCNTVGATPTGATPRNVAITYTVETGTAGGAKVCTSS